MRSYANSRVETGFDWFTQSGVLHAFFKKVDGGGFACPVIDGDVQRDRLISIPGDVDIYGNEIGTNPLGPDAAAST